MPTQFVVVPPFSGGTAQKWRGTLKKIFAGASRRQIVPPLSNCLREQSRNLVLVSIECVDAVRPLKIGVLNVQSLGNKSAAVLDIFVNNTLDLFAAVESWHDSFDSTSIIASTPPGYRVIERARVRNKKQANSIKVNHGGIRIFVRKGIDATVVDFESYKSFEVLPFVLALCRSSSSSYTTPAPHSAVNDEFFADFADVLERTSSFAGCVITGDVNIHLDDLDSIRMRPNSLRCSNCFGLHDLVRQPTHKKGHKLDIFVTRSDQSVSYFRVDLPRAF